MRLKGHGHTKSGSLLGEEGSDAASGNHHNQGKKYSYDNVDDVYDDDYDRPENGAGGGGGQQHLSVFSSPMASSSKYDETTAARASPSQLRSPSTPQNSTAKRAALHLLPSSPGSASTPVPGSVTGGVSVRSQSQQHHQMLSSSFSAVRRLPRNRSSIGSDIGSSTAAAVAAAEIVPYGESEPAGSNSREGARDGARKADDDDDAGGNENSNAAGAATAGGGGASSTSNADDAMPVGDDGASPAVGQEHESGDATTSGPPVPTSRFAYTSIFSSLRVPYGLHLSSASTAGRHSSEGGFAAGGSNLWSAITAVEFYGILASLGVFVMCAFALAVSTIVTLQTRGRELRDECSPKLSVFLNSFSVLGFIVVILGSAVGVAFSKVAFPYLRRNRSPPVWFSFVAFVAGCFLCGQVGVSIYGLRVARRDATYGEHQCVGVFRAVRGCGWAFLASVAVAIACVVLLHRIVRKRAEQHHDAPMQPMQQEDV